jgi:RHS repeat-associated protein
LGNILATITDAKIYQTNGSLAKVISGTDYYAFGAAMPSRSYQDAGYSKYRYGFNNMEKDEETGTHHFKYREDDQDAGRFWSVDPLAAQYPWNSPYAFAENRVTDSNDLEGAERKSRIGYYSSDGYVQGSDHVPTNKIEETIIQLKTSERVKKEVEIANSPEYKVAKQKAYKDHLKANNLYEYGGQVYPNGSTAPNSAVEDAVEFGLTLGSSFFAKKAAQKLLSSSRTLYRGDSRPPWEIVKDGGFRVQGEFDDLIANTIKASPKSSFVSTSKKKDVADLFAERASNPSSPLYKKDLAYVYSMSDNGNGIDVNDYFIMMGKKNDLDWQEEIAFKGGIELKYIQNVQIMRRGKLISNPIPISIFIKKP